MKTAGVIIIVFGSIALLGTLSTESNPLGPLVWIVIGGYLVHRAKVKAEKEEDFDNWKKGGNNA